MIYTVTFNPALDYIVHLPGELHRGHTNRTQFEKIFCGGKGFNVSAVLNALGTENVALGFIGGFTGEEIKKQAAKRGLTCEFFELPEGNTRINVKIKSGMETGSRQETEINATGPSIPQESLDDLYARLDQLEDGDAIVLAGSIPASLPVNLYEEILNRLAGKQILTVVDASGEQLRRVLPHHPFLIKPNTEELAELFGHEPEDLNEIASMALGLQDAGARNVLVTMASEGCLLLTQKGDFYQMDAAKGIVRNSVGAGDSMVAGFLSGWLSGKPDPARALAPASAAITASALRLGTAAGGATAFSDDLADEESILRILQTLPPVQQVHPDAAIRSLSERSDESASGENPSGEKNSSLPDSDLVCPYGTVNRSAQSSLILTGIPCSPGRGVGQARIFVTPRITYEVRSSISKEEENERLQDALSELETRTRAHLEHLQALSAKGSYSLEDETTLDEARLVILRDPELHTLLSKGVGRGLTAESALSLACDTFIQKIAGVDDEHIAQRTADIIDLKDTVLRILQHIVDADTNIPEHTIIVAEDLSASLLSSLPLDRIDGIISQSGGRTSHAAILARSAGIPTVMGISDAIRQIPEGNCVAVDGTEGRITISPSPSLCAEVRRADKACQNAGPSTAKAAPKAPVLQTPDPEPDVWEPIFTSDGVRIRLLRTVDSLHFDASETKADGIGLVRTETLFLGRTHMPTEQEQIEIYRKVIKAAGDHRVVLRTLDIGGDKALPYMQTLPEANPFLGARGVRLWLAHPVLARVQIRAMLRAGVGTTMRIMIPFVTCVEEMRSVRSLVRDVEAQLRAENIPFAEHVPIGCMIETASACMIADLLAPEADFFSIGANDLTQYIMCADRGNASVSDLGSCDQPGVLRAIQRIAYAGTRSGIPVGICGEAAGDPNLVPMFIGMGLTRFTADVRQIPALREAIQKTDSSAWRIRAEQILRYPTRSEVGHTLRSGM